ncbi:MAG: Mur ligase family protein, partial [Psychrobacter sp.]
MSDLVASNSSSPNDNVGLVSLTEWLNYMQQIHVSAIDMGLSRVLPVAEALGVVKSAKDDAYVFTVAGTNGKGSTTAVIAEMCKAAGYKTALYQSPHLSVFNERVRINGEMVSDETLIDAFSKVEAARLECDLTLSFFEMTTLAALLIFAEADCDVWVLEVGLGGRLDVVNIIDPDMAVITNIGID